MSWRPSRKKVANGAGAAGVSPSEKKKIPKPSSAHGGQMNRLIQSDSGEVPTVFESEAHLYNPLNWESMPASLREQFPHWKDSTPTIKCLSPSPKSSPNDAGDQVFQFSASSKLQQPDCTIPYRVMDWDTVNSIALKFDTTPGELARINKKPLGLSFQIFPGEVLYVPDSDALAQLSAAASTTDALSKSTDSTLEGSQETIRSSSISHPSSDEKRTSSPSDRLELSMEWTSGVGEEVADSHLSVSSKYITDDQGCVQGTLLLSKTTLMFRPHSADPVVLDKGREGLEVLLPYQDIVYATLTDECCSPTCDSSTHRTPVAHTDRPEAQPAGNHGNGDAKETTPSPSGGTVSGSSAGDEKIEVSGGEEKEEEKEKGEEKEEEGKMEDEEIEGKIPVAHSMEDECSEDQETEKSSDSVSGSSGALSTEPRAGAKVLTGAGGRTEGDLHGNSGSTDPLQDELFLEHGHPEGDREREVEEGEGKEEEEDEEALAPHGEFGDGPIFLHVQVTSQSMVSHTYKPVDLPKGIEIPKGKRKAQSVSPNIQHVRTKFCFALPARRIDDVAVFLSIHHPTTQEVTALPSDPVNWFRHFFDIVGDSEMLKEEDLHFHDHHFDSSSWEIYSLKDIPRTRIERMEVERNLPLPDLSEDSDLLLEDHIRSLVINLVSRAVGHDWYLIYSTFKHGISLRTLYRNMCNFVDTPVLLVVRDDEQKIFGAMVSSPLRVSDRFYGTGESFLYSFESPESSPEASEDSDRPTFNIYPWTGTNSYFIQGFTDSIGIGSGDGHWGLWLDEAFYHGSSYECSTFDNKMLSSKQDFVCTGLEAWGFLTERN